MKQFRDLSSFVVFMAARRAALPAAEKAGLEAAAKIIAQEARDEIGTYQGAAGPFAAWAPLADSTLNGWRGHPGKIAMGFAPPDNPLLATGDMRDSIGYSVEGLKAVIGSTDPVAVFQELGTSKMPARSFLGGAAFRKAEAAAKAIGKAVAYELAGKPLPKA